MCGRLVCTEWRCCAPVSSEIHLDLRNWQSHHRLVVYSSHEKSCRGWGYAATHNTHTHEAHHICSFKDFFSPAHTHAPFPLSCATHLLTHHFMPECSSMLGLPESPFIRLRPFILCHWFVGGRQQHVSCDIGQALEKKKKPGQDLGLVFGEALSERPRSCYGTHSTHFLQAYTNKLNTVLLCCTAVTGVQVNRGSAYVWSEENSYTLQICLQKEIMGFVWCKSGRKTMLSVH